MSVEGRLPDDRVLAIVWDFRRWERDIHHNRISASWAAQVAGSRSTSSIR